MEKKNMNKKNEEFFFHNEDGDLFEYYDSKEMFVGHYVHDHITLFHPQDTDIKDKDRRIMGFNITWLSELLERAEDENWFGKLSKQLSKERKKILSSKWYHYDKKNDVYEYMEDYSEDKDTDYRKVINKYLTLWYSKTNDKVVGFEINGLQELLDKSEEQKNIPLTPEEQERFDDLLEKLKQDWDKEEDEERKD
jgi:hypothetical protein